jgi:hypothetical protein
MNRHQLLAGLHERLRPRTYLETGVNTGQSMALSRVPSIGVDPEFTVTAELQADVHLARTTSDEFFARERPLAHLPIPVVDLAFVDGMHLSEYALRDVVAVERFMLPTSMILIDDMLPSTVEMASRTRVTSRWTGDVYKVAAALRELRPDLLVVELATAPTGTCLIMLPDATRRGVLPGYDEWVADVAVVPDPQTVPGEVLRRERAMDPQHLLDTVDWSGIRAARDHVRRGEAAPVRALLDDVIRTNAGLGA